MNTRTRNQIIQQKRRRINFFTVITIVLILILAFVLISCKDDSSQTGQEPSGTNSRQNAPDDSTNEASKKFSDIYYYESDNAKRYEAYWKGHGDMSMEDVVWQVNASLDQERYEDYDEVQIDDVDDLLVLVNKYHKLPESYEPTDLVEVGADIKMRSEAANAYKKMSSQAESEDINFIPQSGYRSYSYQEWLYNNYKKSDPKGADTYSARPGFSEHQTGLALDINVPSGGDLHNFDDTEQAKWVSKNAHKYGFIVRYTEANQDITGYINEQWHIRYIGEKHAQNMYDKKIGSYEEYKVKYIDHTPS